MSYILEALKKAQAERQLGNAPTIHAPVVAAVPASVVVRRPLVAGVGVAALLAAAALFMWRQQPAPVRLAAVVPAVQKPVPARAPVRPAPVPAPAPAAHVALVGQADPPAKPVAPERPVVAKPAAPVPAPAAERPAPAPVASVAAATAPPIASVAAVPAPPPAVASADDTVRGVNELPEAVRRTLPKVAFGGYMYSPNPADRLVLVDNILRREGEEVAPGLLLEKLLPKGAVMNYRGYRYRVAF